MNRHVSSHALGALDRMLKGMEGPSRFLVLDDSIAKSLSLYIDGKYLKERGFDCWYRLSSFRTLTLPHDNSTSVMIVAKPCAATGRAIVDWVVERLTTAPAVALHMSLVFVPQRRSGIVSQILLNIRAMLNYTDTVWQDAKNNTLMLGKNLQVAIEDLDIFLYPVDDMTFTLNQTTSFKKLHVDGDISGLKELNVALQQLLSHCAVPLSLPIIGIGEDAVYTAKNLHNYLAASLSFETVPADEEEPKSLHSSTAIHQFATNTIRKVLAGGAAPAAPPSLNNELKPTANIENIVPNDVLNRCIVEAPGLIEEHLSFVPPGSKSKGLVKRVTQSTFLARLPERKTYPSPIKYSGSGRSDKTGLENVRSIIVLDRSLDWASALVTPFTYEAMLDMCWGITNIRHVEIPDMDTDKVARSKGETSSVLRLGSPDDRVYQGLRGIMTTDLGTVLHKEALRVAEQKQNRQALLKPQPKTDRDDKKAPATSVEDLQSVLQEIRAQEDDEKWLTVHTSLVSRIIRDVTKSPAFYSILRIEDDILNSNCSFQQLCDVLERLAWRGAPIVDVVRLLLLGIILRRPELDKSRTRDTAMGGPVHNVISGLVACHGIEAAKLWHDIEISSVIKHHTLTDELRKLLTSSKVEWASQPAAPNARAAVRPSYVHSGYSPLIADVLEAVFDPKRNFLSSLEKSKVADKSNLFISWGLKGHMADEPVARNSTVKESELTTTLLIFPHHITWSELAAIRILERNCKRQLVVVASGILGYGQFFKQFDDPRAKTMSSGHLQLQYGSPYSDLLSSCIL